MNSTRYKRIFFALCLAFVTSASTFAKTRISQVTILGPDALLIIRALVMSGVRDHAPYKAHEVRCSQHSPSSKIKCSIQVQRHESGIPIPAEAAATFFDILPHHGVPVARSPHGGTFLEVWNISCEKYTEEKGTCNMFVL